MQCLSPRGKLKCLSINCDHKNIVAAYTRFSFQTPEYILLFYSINNIQVKRSTSESQLPQRVF